LATRVGGDRVSLIDLTNPGMDSHGLELSVRQVVQVQQADLVLQIPGFQPALDEAGSSPEGLDVVDGGAGTPPRGWGGGAGDGADHTHEGDAEADGHEDRGAVSSDGGHEGGGPEGHDHGPLDPHFWHDPLRMAEVGDALAEHLAQIAPEGGEDFSSAAAQLR